MLKFVFPYNNVLPYNKMKNESEEFMDPTNLIGQNYFVNFAELLNIDVNKSPELYRKLENCSTENEAIQILKSDIFKTQVHALQHPTLNTSKISIPPKTDEEIINLFRSLHVFENNINQEDKLDITIGSKKFQISKILLKKESNYFNALLSSGFKAEEKNTITLPEVDEELATMAFQFMEADDEQRKHFFENVSIKDYEKIYDLYELSERWLFEGLYDAAEAWLAKYEAIIEAIQTKEKDKPFVLSKAFTAKDYKQILDLIDYAHNNKREDLLETCQNWFFTGPKITPENLNTWQASTAGKGVPKVEAYVTQLHKFQNSATQLDPNVNLATLHALYRKLWETHQKNPQALENCLTQELAKNKETLEWTQARHQILNMLETQRSNWEYPENVKNHAENLKTIINGFGISDELKDRYETSSSLGRLALLQFVQRTATIYEDILKSVSGSTRYLSQQQKVKDYAHLLEDYFLIMRTSMSLIPEADEHNLMKPSMGSSESFNTYNAKLHGGGNYRVGFGNVFHSVGFQALVTGAENEEIIPHEQFEQLPTLNIAALKIGSRVDLNFSAHWPRTLYEYYRLFHDNIEKAVNHLTTKEAFDKTILPEAVNTLCSSLNNYPYHIQQNGNLLEIAYQIPLREHAGELKLRFNLYEPEGVDLHLEMFGHDEHDAWDQTAAVGALLGNWNGLSYANGVKPQNNYEGENMGVSFGVHIPQDHVDTQRVLNICIYLLKELSMASVRNLSATLEQKLPGLDWATVPDQFFQDAYYLSPILLQANTDNTALTNHIAKNSLLGLARANLSDYRRGFVDIQDVDAFMPEQVPDDLSQQGLILSATLHLLKGLHEDTANTLPIVQELVDNAELNAKQPHAMQLLKQALDSLND